jgi:hypothetical protein
VCLGIAGTALAQGPDTAPVDPIENRGGAAQTGLGCFAPSKAQVPECQEYLKKWKAWKARQEAKNELGRPTVSGTPAGPADTTSPLPRVEAPRESDTASPSEQDAGEAPRDSAAKEAEIATLETKVKELGAKLDSKRSRGMLFLPYAEICDFELYRNRNPGCADYLAARDRLAELKSVRQAPDNLPDTTVPSLSAKAPAQIDIGEGAFQITGYVGDDRGTPRFSIDGKALELTERLRVRQEGAGRGYRFDIEIPVDRVGERRVTLEACDKADNCVAERVVVRVTGPGSAEPAALSAETAARIRERLAAIEAEREAAEARARRAEEAARRLAAAQAREPSAAEPVDQPNVEARNHALIIGNSTYRHLPGLKTAVGDAREMARLLTSRYAFRTENTTLLLDADRRAILGALEDLRRRIQPDDRLLIYYAGHGQIDTVTDEGFWQPVDAEPGLQFTWIANDDVRRYLKGMPAKHVLVVADSCFSGSLTRSTGEYGAIGRERFFAAIDAGVSRKVISSGGTEPVADAGSRGHSVFAYYLLKMLRENDRPYLASFELFAKLARAVTNNSSQKPQYGTVMEAGDEGAGDFTFILKSGG